MWIRLFAAMSTTWAMTAAAQQMPTPENVVHLSAQASVEMPMDWLAVVFATTSEGPDAGPVQRQLKQALEAALAEARKVARIGELEVKTGQFSLTPRYAPKGGSQGWVGSAELIVEGRDAEAIAQLTGRIQSMSIRRVGYSLSREARERVEGEVVAQAVERFRDKAQQTAKLFGFTGYLLREVHVGGNVEQAQTRVNFAQVRSAGAMAMSDQALPTEAGKSTVTGQVNGSVQLTR